MNYWVNDRTGEVHEEDCPRVKVIKSKTVWDPAKAALTPGVFADRICLHGKLPLRQAPEETTRITWSNPADEQRRAWIRDQFCDCEGHGLADDQHSPSCHGLEVAAAVRRAEAGRWVSGDTWAPGGE